MSKVNELAGRVVERFSNYGGDRQAAFDPAFIMVIAEIIVQLVEALQSCQEDPVAGVEMVNNPSVFAKLVARRSAIKELGRRQFRLHGENVMNSLLDTGQGMTAADMQALYNEV